MVPIRTFRDALFPKQVTGQELFFAVYYSKPALTNGTYVIKLPNYCKLMSANLHLDYYRLRLERDRESTVLIKRDRNVK